MVSNSLRQLRQAPAEAGDIVSTLIQSEAAARQDITLAQPARVQKITLQLDRARTALFSLQDSVNDAEAAVQAKAQTGNTAASESSTSKVRWAFDSGLDLRSVLQQLVDDNDKDGINAVSANLGLLARANKLGYPATLPLDKALAEAKQTVNTYRRQVASQEELIAAAEEQETSANMGFLRVSFSQLFAYVNADVTLHAQGAIVKPTAIHNWYGLGDAAIAQLRQRGITWDVLPKNKVLISSDLDIAVPSEIGGPGSGAYDGNRYLWNGGQSGAWRDKPVSGGR